MSEHLGRKRIDLYEVLEPILLRPAMWFGRPSITAFFHFYFGMQYLGGCGHGGPFMYKLDNDLFNSGFVDWVNEKREFSPSVGTSHSYLCVARKKLEDEGYCVASVSPHKVEEEGWDLFVADLKEFREIPKNMTWWQFMDRIDELKKEPEQGCFVARCACGMENCFYEGVLTYLFKRVNDPCAKCKKTTRDVVLVNGVGEEYEL